MPHMMFLVDFVARGLAQGLDSAARSWVLFGLGRAWRRSRSAVWGSCCRTTHAQKAAWTMATTSFALFQAVAAYGFSYLFVRTAGDYRLLFELGGAALCAALALDLASDAVHDPRRPHR